MTDLPSEGGRYLRDKDGTLHRQSDLPPAQAAQPTAAVADDIAPATTTPQGGTIFPAFYASTRSWSR